MLSSSPRSGVQWAKAIGLAVMQAAISLSWVAYNLYLPGFLTQFGLPQSYGVGLLIAESVLAIGIEPVTGYISDRAFRQLGSRIPFITLGVLVTVGLFLAIPVLAIGGNPALSPLLLTLLILWSMAMAAFRSPAICLLGIAAFETQLPQAASVLNLAGAVVGTLNTFAQPKNFILGLGAPVTFAIASAVLLAATAVLRWVYPPQVLASYSDTTTIPWSRQLLYKLGCVFGVGVGISLGTRLINTVLKHPTTSPGLLVGIFTMTFLVAVLPAGWLSSKVGNQRTLLLGSGLMALVLPGLVWAIESPLAAGLTVLLGIGSALLSNGTVAYALSMAPRSQIGLGAGIFFGGSALAGALFGLLLQMGPIALPIAAIGGTLAFVGVGLLVWQGQQVR